MSEVLGYAVSPYPVEASVRRRIRFRIIAPRLVLGCLFLLGALRIRLHPLEWAWARTYASFDSRMTHSSGGDANGPYNVVVVKTPVRLFWSHPGRVAKGFGFTFGTWDTGLPVMAAVFPLLVVRWRRVSAIALAVAGAVLLTSAVNLLRVWLVYLSLFTNLPHFEVVLETNYWLLFGAEVALCLVFCERVADRRARRVLI